jgi:hypothetical protein
MFECRATERLLQAMSDLGASLHHPLEGEAREALRGYGALDSFDRQSAITHALLPALQEIARRVGRRARSRRRRTRQDAPGREARSAGMGIAKTPPPAAPPTPEA